jgi:hypothetical protein
MDDIVHNEGGSADVTPDLSLNCPTATSTASASADVRTISGSSAIAGAGGAAVSAVGAITEAREGLGKGATSFGHVCDPAAPVLACATETESETSGGVKIKRKSKGKSKAKPRAAAEQALVDDVAYHGNVSDFLSNPRDAAIWNRRLYRIQVTEQPNRFTVANVVQQRKLVSVTHLVASTRAVATSPCREITRRAARGALLLALV